MSARPSDKIAKLLRLAASESAPEPERISAALAAAKLFVKTEDEQKAKRREARVAEEKPKPPTRDASSSEGGYNDHVHYETQHHVHDPVVERVDNIEPEVEAWQRSRAGMSPGACFMCSRPIQVNAEVWRRVDRNQVQWIHGGCPRPGRTGL